MLKLNAKVRDAFGKKTSKLRNADKVPAVVYGHKVKNVSLELDYKDFVKVFKQTGESSLIELSVEGEKDKRPVLVHDVQIDPVSDRFLHVDFFQASLKEEVEVKVPLLIEGESLAVKDLGGTLVKNISEIEIKALPQNLPHEIVVNIDSLKTFEDRILAKNLNLPEGVKLKIKPDEIIVSVAPPANVEAELEKPIEEKVEEIEKVEKEKKEEVLPEEPTKEQEKK